jgi:predicted HicB family RNase H-like nuclease
MTTISIRLPDSLHKMAKNIASEDHVSMNQFIASAVAEKISALAALPALTPEIFDRQ